MLYVLVLMLLASLVLAFISRALWTFSLPGVLLLMLILYMLFV